MQSPNDQDAILKAALELLNNPSGRNTYLKGTPLQNAFGQLKTNLELNDSFQEAIEQKHNAVRSVIENNGHDVETKLIGSLQRQTRIQPLPDDTFDIDILVILGEFNNWVAYGGITPQGALERLQSIVEESDRYGGMDPSQDAPVISFEYEDGVKVELVPAYKDLIGYSPDGKQHTPVGRGYWVSKNGRWELADYDYEADHITQKNAETEKWFIPTIKMLKAIRRLYIPDLTAYHLEIIASYVLHSIYQTRRQRNMGISYPILITDFFDLTPVEVLTQPIKMLGSNSPEVELDTLSQIKVINSFEAIKKHCNMIYGLGSESDKIKQWRELFGDPFPV